MLYTWSKSTVIKIRNYIDWVINKNKMHALKLTTDKTLLCAVCCCPILIKLPLDTLPIFRQCWRQFCNYCDVLKLFWKYGLSFWNFSDNWIIILVDHQLYYWISRRHPHIFVALAKKEKLKTSVKTFLSLKSCRVPIYLDNCTIIVKV